MVSYGAPQKRQKCYANRQKYIFKNTNNRILFLALTKQSLPIINNLKIPKKKSQTKKKEKTKHDNDQVY